jgi:hypothetical protein
MASRSTCWLNALLTMIRWARTSGRLSSRRITAAADPSASCTWQITRRPVNRPSTSQLGMVIVLT